MVSLAKADPHQMLMTACGAYDKEVALMENGEKREMLSRYAGGSIERDRAGWCMASGC